MTLHYTTLQLQLHYFTLDYTTLYRTTVHHTTVHYTALHSLHHITPHHNYNFNYTTLITLHYNYNSTTPHYNYNFNCTTPHYIQQLWVRRPLQLQKAQPPFAPSVDSLFHPCITTTHLSFSVLSLKLPPPPCAVLPVYNEFYTTWLLWIMITHIEKLSTNYYI